MYESIYYLPNDNIYIKIPAIVETEVITFRKLAHIFNNISLDTHNKIKDIPNININNLVHDIVSIDKDINQTKIELELVRFRLKAAVCAYTYIEAMLKVDSTLLEVMKTESNYLIAQIKYNLALTQNKDIDIVNKLKSDIDSINSNNIFVNTEFNVDLMNFWYLYGDLLIKSNKIRNKINDYKIKLKKSDQNETIKFMEILTKYMKDITYYKNKLKTIEKYLSLMNNYSVIIHHVGFIIQCVQITEKIGLKVAPDMISYIKTGKQLLKAICDEIKGDELSENEKQILEYNRIQAEIEYSKIVNESEYRINKNDINVYHNLAFFQVTSNKSEIKFFNNDTYFNIIDNLIIAAYLNIETQTELLSATRAECAYLIKHYREVKDISLNNIYKKCNIIIATVLLNQDELLTIKNISELRTRIYDLSRIINEI